MVSKYIYKIESADRTHIAGIYRLPKQFFYWLRKNNITSMLVWYSKRYKTDTANLCGHGRNWRINCFGIFEVSCKIKDFDRWANSNLQLGVDVRKFTSENQAKEIISNMLARAKELDFKYEDRFKD